jgi:hypothetical protein
VDTETKVKENQRGGGELERRDREEIEDREALSTSVLTLQALLPLFLI